MNDQQKSAHAALSDRIRGICIGKKATLWESMVAIQRGACGLALIIDSRGRLLGTVTDGDIRRALLEGGAFQDPIDKFMHREFTFVTPTTGRAEVIDIMRAKVLRQIPILDSEGRLVGLHLMREILGAVPRPNWAVVMAGGRGERLRPLTDTIPKPMVRVAGRPILERIILHLVGFGIQRVFLSVNYLGEVIERYFGEGTALGCRIEYIKEQRPMGTGGALSLLPEQPIDPLIVLYGDLVTQFDVGAMLAFHEEGRYEATVGVHKYFHTIPYGVVQMEGGRITEVREKPTYTWKANAGIYVLNPDLLVRIPRDADFPLPALIEDCLEQGAPVGGFTIEEDWMDVGHTVELRRARGVEDEQ